MLLGKNPEFFLHGSYVQYVRFNGKGREGSILREVKFSANLITMLDRLDGFIDTSLVKKKPVPVSVLREDLVLNYPYWALRELLMNAVMHRDYQSNMPVRLYQFDDRIEIMNAGGLYGNARPENFPDVNDYRNPVIAETMRVLGFVNRFSRGVARVNTELIANGNEEAVFDFSKLTVFETTVFRSKNFLQKTTQKTTQKLSDIQNIILDLIHTHPRITRKQIAEEIHGITPDGIKYHLDELKSKEKIERKGGRKTGYWQINENNL